MPLAEITKERRDEQLHRTAPSHRRGPHRRGRRHRRHRLSAPAGGSSAPRATDSGTYTIWDPYPQFAKGSAWAKLLDDLRHRGRGEDQADRRSTPATWPTRRCSPRSRATPRTSSSSTTRWCRPSPRRACSPRPTTTSWTPRRWTPTCSRPASRGGKTYGTPIGANTLALYYNKKVLKEAGVDIASVKDWDVADGGAGEGQEGGQEGHHVLRDRHRGGQLPVPAVVLGLGRAADRPRLRRGRLGTVAVERLAEEGVRPQLGASTTPRPPAGRSSRPATTPSPRTAPGSSRTPRRPASSTACSRSPAPPEATRPPRPAVSSSPSPSRTTPAATPPPRS